MEDYRTVRGTATGEYEEKKSRFIAQLSFADSEEAAVAFLEQVRDVPTILGYPTDDSSSSVAFSAQSGNHLSDTYLPEEVHVLFLTDAST